MKKIKFTGILMSCILVFSMCSCNGLYEYFFDDEEGFSSDMNEFLGQFNNSESEVSYKEPPKIEVSDYYTTPYDNPFERELSEKEIEIYNLFCYYIEHYKLEFDFYDADENEVIKAYKAVIEDHPEYFWLTKGYRYTKTTSGNKSDIDFKPILYGGSEGITAKERKLKSKVGDIVSQAEDMDTVYEKVLFVHDYIVENTTYDHDAAADESNNESDTDPYFDSRTAYGCLISGRAVCSGYAAAFQYIMKELGIPCGRVSGKSVEKGELHEWNYLRIGDYNYQMDVTWDDATISSDDEQSERVSYDYFLITTEEAELTHIINDDQNIPECNGIEYNYYIYNNLYFDEYDFDYTAYAIKERIDSGDTSVSLKFANEYERERAYYDLIENDRVFGIDGIGRHISYIKGNNGLTLTINNF